MNMQPELRQETVPAAPLRNERIDSHRDQQRVDQDEVLMMRPRILLRMLARPMPLVEGVAIIDPSHGPARCQVARG